MRTIFIFHEADNSSDRTFKSRSSLAATKRNDKGVIYSHQVCTSNITLEGIIVRRVALLVKYPTLPR